jgi:hypothetical protein
MRQPGAIGERKKRLGVARQRKEAGVEPALRAQPPGSLALCRWMKVGFWLVDDEQGDVQRTELI